MKQMHKFKIEKKYINFAQTLQCGQIFSYQEIAGGFLIFSADKMAKVTEFDKFYEVETDDKCYFENFFDLQTDYDDIKSKLQGDEILRDKVIFGQGIRILRQNLLEVVVSFCISANNNIKRITKSLFYLREKFGNKKDGFFAFPTLNQLSKMTENDFLSLGVGYRAKQLVKLVSQLQQVDINSWTAFDTDTLRAKLVALSGIGPKVADCILLFGYGRTDVFPVDTWIAKSFKKDFQNITDRKIMRQILVQKYQNLAGYAQQYMFFYAREHKIS